MGRNVLRELTVELDPLSQEAVSNLFYEGLALYHLGYFEEAASVQNEADGFAVGLIHAALGYSERAFHAFGHVEEWAAWPTLSLHHFYPGILNPLRDDPRYSRLLETVARSWGVEEPLTGR